MNVTTTLRYSSTYTLFVSAKLLALQIVTQPNFQHKRQRTKTHRHDRAPEFSRTTSFVSRVRHSIIAELITSSAKFYAADEDPKPSHHIGPHLSLGYTSLNFIIFGRIPARTIPEHPVQILPTCHRLTDYHSFDTRGSCLNFGVQYEQ